MISIEEMQKDIADTLAEIAQMEREAEGLRMMSDRLSHFRADARVTGIAERKEFVRKLEALIAKRKVAP